MANRFTTLNIRLFQGTKIFTFTTTSGKVYNLSLYGNRTNERLTFLPVDSIDGLLSNLNNRIQDPDKFNWICGTFNSYRNGLPLGIVKILPVYEITTGIYGIDTRLIIIDTSFLPESATAAAESAIPAAAQPGGSLYDNKGKLLYRGQMKNGLPHGYGTGYYANGKVGHVGMFKGGKIVQ